MDERGTLEFLRYHGNSRDLVLVVAADGKILGCSASVTPILGYEQDELVGRSAAELLHPDDFVRTIEEYAADSARFGATRSYRRRFAHKNGTYTVFETARQNLIDSDGFSIVTARDFTEQVAIELERDRVTQGLEALATSAPIAIYRLDQNQECIFVNDRWTELTGQTMDDAIGTGYLAVVNRRDLIQLSEIANSELMGGSAEIRMHPITGGTRFVVSRWARLVDNGCGVGIVGTLEDITQQKTLEARLLHQATHDSLTGLPNRVIINEHLTKAIERAKRNSEVVTVVFCDLDRFKIVNDSLGHDTGDRLLVAVSDRLRSVLRSADVLGRFGGDEFIVIASGAADCDVDNTIAERIVAAFAEPFDIGTGRGYPCTASLGIARSVPDSTPESLLRDADVAMYRAKERGRGRAEEFDEVLRSRALDRYGLQTDLSRAIANNEMTVLYQPIVAMHGNGVRGVEALVRWDHPTRGRLSPDVFVPIAEETRFILELGEWVLNQACTEILPLTEMKLSVNLSAAQVHDQNLVTRVDRVLQKTGFPASRLTLEITETVLVHDADTTIAALKELKQLGVSIAVDDFGTGYSSLNYLSRFPVDVLKVDRSFVQGLSNTAGDGEIVRAVIGLAHALGLSATAEGVETTNQLEQLQRLGCDMAQGFLFERPLELDGLKKLASGSWNEGLAKVRSN